ncbi:FYVE, RhoGEF and PH domain-containing protein 4 [Lamellibrachia satsuma]|nr:FYVE, RhoGEF and PH domain-containing protein 4 [Lamellibrachia satsuma]
MYFTVSRFTGTVNRYTSVPSGVPCLSRKTDQRPLPLANDRPTPILVPRNFPTSSGLGFTISVPAVSVISSRQLACFLIFIVFLVFLVFLVFTSSSSLSSLSSLSSPSVQWSPDPSRITLRDWICIAVSDDRHGRTLDNGMDCGSIRSGPNVKTLANQLDGVFGSKNPQRPQFVVQRQFTQNTVHVAVPDRRKTVQVIRLSPRLRPKNNNAASDSDPFSSDFEHLIGDDDYLGGSVIDTSLDSLDWEQNHSADDVVWEEQVGNSNTGEGKPRWENNISYVVKANDSVEAQLRPTEVTNRKASRESDVVEEVFEPERLPPFPPPSPAEARASPPPSTPSPPPPLLPPSPPPPFVPPLEETYLAQADLQSSDDDTFQVSSYQSSLTPSSCVVSHVTSTDTIPYIDDAASGRTASTGSRDSTPTPSDGIDEYPDAPLDDYQYSYSSGRRKNARSRGASYENVDIVRYTIATAAAQKSADDGDKDRSRKNRSSAYENVDEVRDTLKRDKPAANKMDDSPNKMTSDDSRNTSQSSRSSSFMQTDQWSPEIKIESPAPISDDCVFSPTSPIALSTCYQECMAVKVPMFRSQSARASRTSYENVARDGEPPRRQSDIVRSVRSPAYENASTFHVRRPNSFDIVDLRRDSSSPPTEPRRSPMATFSSPSPKKESRGSQNATTTIPPVNAKKTKPQLSPYISTTTTTFTSATFAPVASPEVTSPGDSGYGYAFSPEQSPRENNLPLIRESSDDSDSANAGSPRPMWTTPEMTVENSAAKAKPLKKKDSGRRTSRKMPQEEEENERSESENSYYSDSDFDENDSSGTSSISIDSVPSQHRDSAAAYTDEITPDSLADSAADLLVSERTYVDHLHFLCRVVLLDLKVLSKVQDVHALPPATIEQLFPSIDTIFNFHACNFLPRLEERVRLWEQKSYICDIVNDLLSFLVVYQRYVDNIKTSIKMIDTFRNTHPVFAALLDEVEKVPECRRLPVKQHMLDIAQRVSTYRDFLKEYNSNLSDDAEEKPDIKEALDTITRTAYEMERTLGKEERMKTLKEMQRRLDTSVNFVTPTGELIKEGKMKAISSQTNKKADRYMFLLNEALLICPTAGIGGKHKLKHVIDVDGMQIYEGDNLHLPNTFYVHGRRKTIELQASSAEQKHEWVKRIRQVIDEFTTRKLSKSLTINYVMSPDDVGKVKPEKASTSGVSACPACGAHFKGTKRKHHCKACGQVVCAKCCTQKARLEFADFRMCKVCDECYVIIRQRELRLGGDSWVTSLVEAAEPGVVSGYLLLSADRGHSWSKRWMVVHSNAMMYCFKTNKDKSPFTSLPIRRFTVSATRKDDPIHKNNSFKLHNMKKVYYLQAPDTNATLSWLKVLGERQSVSE